MLLLSRQFPGSTRREYHYSMVPVVRAGEYKLRVSRTINFEDHSNEAIPWFENGVGI